MHVLLLNIEKFRRLWQCRFLKPKMHPIFLDNDLNGRDIVLLNIYQTLRICALKFYQYSLECKWIGLPFLEGILKR